MFNDICDRIVHFVISLQAFAVTGVLHRHLHTAVQTATESCMLSAQQKLALVNQVIAGVG